MTQELRLTIEFHSRFRIGAAYGLDGFDLAVDRYDPLPGDHLKGVMRAAARQLTRLGCIAPHLTDEVYGTVESPSPWTWLSAVPVNDLAWQIGRATRVKIDALTNTATKDMLVFAQDAWCQNASFSIVNQGVGAAPPEHLALLRLSARATHHIGSWRRRGAGWVTITPDDNTTAENDLQQVTP